MSNASPPNRVLPAVAFTCIRNTSHHWRVHIMSSSLSHFMTYTHRSTKRANPMTFG